MASSSGDPEREVSIQSDPADEVSSLIADWRGERPDLGLDSVRIFFPLRRALQAAESRRAGILAEFGVTPAMVDVLVALRRSGRPYVRTPSELTRLLALSAGGVSQRLDRLEQAGFVERTVSTQDRRWVHVGLTKRGLATLDALMTRYMAHEEELLHTMSARDREQLAKLLLRLERSILSARPAERPGRKAIGTKVTDRDLPA
jgi:DNA-binding MarR family transcriptional regulator